MKINRLGIATKTTALVENHSYLACLLALLCLIFAINVFYASPGSDGGSGLGGTGKFGGESGLGGTGKGPGFKLGAAGSDSDESYEDYLVPDNDNIESKEAIESFATPLMAEYAPPVLDINSLRLSLDDAPALSPEMINATHEANNKVAGMVASITLSSRSDSGSSLDSPTSEPAYEEEQLDIIDVVMDHEKDSIISDTLVSSFDILNGLMVAEAETSLALSETKNLTIADTSAEEAAIRSRLAIPVRPERPDRFNVPTRITPVQRVDIPAPPPVRPMRTLSTLLNR